MTDQGQMWPKYLPLATLAHNTFSSPNLANYRPYELMFGEKTKNTNRHWDRPRYKGFGKFYRILQTFWKMIKVFAGYIAIV